MKKEETKPNVIYYTTNYEVLEEVVKKLDEVKNSDFLKGEFIERLAKYIFNRTGIVLVSFNEDKKLNGCAVISRHLDKQGEYLWLDFRWVDPNYERLSDLFFNEVIGICKMRGIKRIQGRSNRGFRLVNRYYGAYEIGRIFELKVEGALMKDDSKR